MNMDSYDILVIILSVFLAIFLLLGIIVLVYLLKVVKTIKVLSEKAVNVVDNAETVTANISKYVTPTLVGRQLYKRFSKAFNKKG